MSLLCTLIFTVFLIISLIFYFLGLYFLHFNLEIYIEYKLLFMNSISLEMVLFLDWVSFMFMSFVFFIFSLIVKYSNEYMHGDKNLKRFILLMMLFVGSMMMVILSPNLVSILLGWDGLGLVSYVLVTYYQNVKSYNAGMLTALSNRIGDAAILMGIACMADIGSWNFTLYSEYMKINSSNILLLMMMIVLAAFTKSAQIPFSSWLPAAMAAPTPVSSLVHSSTLVTAGVYLLFRFSFIFSVEMMKFMLFISLLTMFMAGLGANFEFDLKKIIALSTLSQLGMMVTILSLGEKNLAFFHLLIHALFKALLFMCAGAIIHNMGNIQDIRYMGGFINFFPLTCACMNISNMALCGLPFLSGFYSKDLIVENFSMKFSSIFIYVIYYLSVGLTVSYSMRLSYYLIFGEFNMLSFHSFSENKNKIMLKGMLGLVFLVIFKGSILSWLLFPTPYFIILPLHMKMMTLLVIFLGALLGFEFSMMKYMFMNKSFKLYNLSMYFSGMWNMPILSTFGVNSYFLKLGKIYFKKIDSGWLEYYGSNGLFKLLMNFSQIFQLISRNHLKVFLFIILLITILLIMIY